MRFFITYKKFKKLLKANGVSFIEEQLKSLLQIVIICSPCFPNAGTLDLDLWEQVGRNLKRNQAQGKWVPLSSLTMGALVWAALCPLHIEDQKPTEHHKDLSLPPPPEVEPVKPVIPKTSLSEEPFWILHLWCGKAHQLDPQWWDHVSGNLC